MTRGRSWSRAQVAIGTSAAIIALAVAATIVAGAGDDAAPSHSATSRSASPTSATGIPAQPPTAVAATGSEQILIGAADLDACDSTIDETTAEVVGGSGGTIFVVGDITADNADLDDFDDCLGSSWGEYKDSIRPVPGNNDYDTSGAEGYFDYFGALAGEAGEGYYSYELGAWHVVALNSNCGEVGGCEEGSAQEVWLREDLAASDSQCTVAYWHHPLFTSGDDHEPDSDVRDLFQALYDYDAEIVMSGHNHQYERFAPQDPDGVLDEARGIRQFVVGTGGGDLDGFDPDIEDNSEVRESDAHGVLELLLSDTGYQWYFLPVDGVFVDSGSATCH